MRKLRRVLRSSWWVMAVATTVRWFYDPNQGPHRRATARAWIARLAALAGHVIDEERHAALAHRLGQVERWADPIRGRALTKRATFPGVAQDATTLADVVSEFERRGYGSQFIARDDAVLECVSCRVASKAAEVPVDDARRLEGASDPDDMLAVSAVRCPNCGAGGILVSQYGPAASTGDVQILHELRDPPAPKRG
jgi:hypothetical protein